VQVLSPVDAEPPEAEAAREVETITPETRDAQA